MMTNVTPLLQQKQQQQQLNNEDDVYDRQIRLWGADAQAKMSKCQVLYIHMTGISSEILKNLVLAGIRAVVCDNRPYPEAVVSTPSFFLPLTQPQQQQQQQQESHELQPKEYDNGKEDDDDDGTTTATTTKRRKLSSSSSSAAAAATTKAPKTVAEAMKSSIELLNPLLGECVLVSKNLNELDDEYIQQFDIVIASRISMEDAIRISLALQRSTTKQQPLQPHVEKETAATTTISSSIPEEERRNKNNSNNNSTGSSSCNGKLFMVDSFGMYGICCIDLGKDHIYRAEVGNELLNPQYVVPYIPIQDMFQYPLVNCITRYYKTPPPVWIMYRSILEYVQVQKQKQEQEQELQQQNDQKGLSLKIDSCWPTPNRVHEFVSIVTNWFQRTAPSLLLDSSKEKDDATETTSTSTSTSTSTVTSTIAGIPVKLEQIPTIANAEIAPVCAVLGGLVSNEVIKAISGKGTPSNNIIFFDGSICKAAAFLVGSSGTTS